MKTLSLLICSALLLAGCIKPYPVERPSFADFYRYAEPKKPQPAEEGFNLPAISIVAKDMPLRAFLRLVAEQGGVSIITDEGLENRTVTFEVEGIRADKVLAALARRLNVSISRDGNLFHIGSVQPEDRALYITRCARLTANDTKQAIETIMSSNGRCVAFPDGLLVVADKVELIGRIASLLEDIRRAQTDTWVLQFQILNYRHADQRDLGLTVNSNFGVAVAAGEEDGSGISAQLARAVDSGRARLVAQPLILVEDGTTARISDGETIPIPTKTVSPEGVVTTTGVQYKETGISIQAYIRDMGDGLARLTTQIGINATAGYVEGYPIVKGTTADFTSAIRAGQPYLVCNMTQDYDSKQSGLSLSSVVATLTGNSGGMSLRRSKQASQSLTQIWVRAYKIGGMQHE